MGNVSDDDRWLHSAAPQAGYNDRDAGLDADNDSVAGEASDVNNLCNGVCVVFHFVGVRLTFRLRLSLLMCFLAESSPSAASGN
jgi:hypothetical protein